MPIPPLLIRLLPRLAPTDPALEPLLVLCRHTDLDLQSEDFMALPACSAIPSVVPLEDWAPTAPRTARGLAKAGREARARAESLGAQAVRAWAGRVDGRAIVILSWTTPSASRPPHPPPAERAALAASRQLCSMAERQAPQGSRISSPAVAAALAAAIASVRSGAPSTHPLPPADLAAALPILALDERRALSLHSSTSSPVARRPARRM